MPGGLEDLDPPEAGRGEPGGDCGGEGCCEFESFLGLSVSDET